MAATVLSQAAPNSPVSAVAMADMVVSSIRRDSSTPIQLAVSSASLSCQPSYQPHLTACVPALCFNFEMPLRWTLKNGVAYAIASRVTVAYRFNSLR